MKNGDKPIHPTTSQKINETEFFEYNLPNKEKKYSGLTKREYFAGLAMQGILFNPPYGHIDCKRGEDLIDIVKLSVDYADELLKQLEN